jgi:hypothetical protein
MPAGRDSECLAAPSPAGSANPSSAVAGLDSAEYGPVQPAWYYRAGPSSACLGCLAAPVASLDGQVARASPDEDAPAFLDFLAARVAWTVAVPDS